MKNNYHTHTSRCMHAAGSVEDYVLSGIKGGFKELGFSDHTPWPFKNRYVSGIRMTVEELPGYVKSVRNAGEKYQGQISVKLGLECEYYDDYIPWLKEVVERYEMDYLIFGNHFYKTEERYPYFGHLTKSKDLFKLYLESSIKGMESGLFAYYAHPDLFMRGYREFDEHCEDMTKEICRQSLALDIPLEYNLEGARAMKRGTGKGYPHPEFWKIAAEFGCKTIIGMDAHHNKQLEDTTYVDSALEFLEGIGANLVDEIRFLR